MISKTRSFYLQRWGFPFFSYSDRALYYPDHCFGKLVKVTIETRSLMFGERQVFNQSQTQIRRGQGQMTNASITLIILTASLGFFQMIDPNRAEKNLTSISGAQINGKNS